ncbi:head completion/stabilization protein [Novosphingopyxis sp. YJ-S2-01]|uniref:head completion/stabilization protein n=1 Tax=Novosphingopyxis sp. YJ-S2-01 TaxID=2794021 RepID=UPI0018DE9D85|nr:head completion/stabilization protein [Novosphingopyxis sp. YJ-S2-01]MBH9537885.1 head completion/stabilization protein [Novosphingopyxis sp. YJ-S2-01]
MPSSPISVIAPPLADRAVDPAEDAVTCGPFWPALSIAAFRKVQRLDDAITPERARAALQGAMQTALLDLAEFALAAVAMNQLTLAEIPAAEIDGQSFLVLAWQRAIHAFAKAELIESHRDYDATGRGGVDPEVADRQVARLRADGKLAVRDILGRPRLRAELI